MRSLTRIREGAVRQKVQWRHMSREDRKYSIQDSESSDGGIGFTRERRTCLEGKNPCCPSLKADFEKQTDFTPVTCLDDSETRRRLRLI